MFKITDRDCFLFLNGTYEDNKNFYRDLIKDNKNIFCADGGTKFCYELNLIPKEIWGDFDSFSLKDKIILYYKNKNKNLIIKKYEIEKDFTDMELLLEYLHNKYEKIFCLFALSEDMDHTLTNINLIKIYNNIVFINSRETIFYIKEDEEFIFENKKEREISFIPLSNIENLTLQGFKYELNSVNVRQGLTLCSRNIIVKNKAKINYKKGEILAVIKNY